MQLLGVEEHSETYSLDDLHFASTGLVTGSCKYIMARPWAALEIAAPTNVLPTFPAHPLHSCLAAADGMRDSGSI
jgi:hypothetical protein